MSPSILVKEFEVRVYAIQVLLPLIPIVVVPILSSSRLIVINEVKLHRVRKRSIRDPNLTLM